MSAQEIIERIKALPPRDRAVVVEFARSLNVECPIPQFVDPAKAKRCAVNIFDQHDELFRQLAQH